MRLFEHLLTVHMLIVTLGLTVYVTSTRSLQLRRHPSAAIAWVVTLVLLPYTSLPLYLIFGIRKVKLTPAPAKTPTLPLNFAHADSLTTRTQQLAASMRLAPASAYYQFNLHQDGAQALAVLMKMIDSATHTIDICTFILAADALGDEIVQRLKRRAREGLRVRLLVDGVGVYLGGRHDFKQLQAAGIEVTLFVPPLRSTLRGRTNLRNHRKLVIVDHTWLWSGGRNLAAEYFLGTPRRTSTPPAWVDLSLDLQGPLAEQAQQLFEQDWYFATSGRLAATSAPISFAAGAGNGQLIASGPDQNDDTLYTLLISGFFHARKRILVVTPYFVPDPTLLMSLSLAVRRGVTLDLVLPKHSNHRLADLARHRALRELSAAGARIWMLPRMIHAKTLVIDDELAFVGTANLDERSLFLNYELMLALYADTDVARVARWIEQQREAAQPYQAQASNFWRETAEGLVLWLAFQL